LMGCYAGPLLHTSVLLCAVVCCSVLLRVAARFSACNDHVALVFAGVAVWYSMVQCVAA